jgi:F-type H+-transporting ATPase subunit b
MNIFFMPLMQMVEGAGGLFDFNATLPIMALQFILLTVVLTFVFYKPVAKVIEDRDTMINNNLTEASAKLLKADQLYKQYDEQLKSARSNAQLIIAESEKEAKEIVAKKIDKAKDDASKLIQQTNTELESQKSLALQKLETQVDELSDLIKDKLLGNQAVR